MANKIINKIENLDFIENLKLKIKNSILNEV